LLGPHQLSNQGKQLSIQVTTKKMLMKVCAVIFVLMACLPLAHAQINSKVLKSSKTMAYVAEGAFDMGSNAGPDDEKPKHSVFVK